MYAAYSTFAGHFVVGTAQLVAYLVIQKVKFKLVRESFSKQKELNAIDNLSARTFLYVAFLVVLLTLYLYVTSIPSVGAQASEQGRVIYVRNSKSGFQAVSYATRQATNVYDGRCSRFSSELDYLAQFDLQNPNQLTFFNLDTGLQGVQISWQSIWGQDMAGKNCLATYWLNNQIFVLPNVEEPQRVYYIDRDTGLVSGPFAATPSPAIPNRNPKSNIILFSPEGQQVVYEQCEQPNCVGNSDYVIYDVQQQQVVAVLTGHDYLEGSPRPSKQFFSWSHSGRYLAHYSISREIAIYDVVNKAYLDLSFLPTDIDELVTRSAGWQWSPDSTQISFWVDNATALGHNIDHGLAILDLEAHSFQLLETQLDAIPVFLEGWAWTPSGESLLVTHSDNQLFEVNLIDGSQTFIADQVSIILAWYPAELMPSS